MRLFLKVSERLSVLIPALSLVFACGGQEENRQSISADSGSADELPAKDGPLHDATPFDGGMPDSMAADVQVIEDRCDCEDLGPCLILPPFCSPGICNYRSLDRDGDGYPPRGCGGDDCDDANPAIYPEAPEVCDGLDNDCDGAVDEDITPPCK